MTFSATFAAPQINLFLKSPLADKIPMQNGCEADFWEFCAAKGGEPPAWLSNGFMKLEGQVVGVSDNGMEDMGMCVCVREGV